MCFLQPHQWNHNMGTELKSFSWEGGKQSSTLSQIIAIESASHASQCFSRMWGNFSLVLNAQKRDLHTFFLSSLISCFAALHFGILHTSFFLLIFCVYTSDAMYGSGWMVEWIQTYTSARVKNVKESTHDRQDVGVIFSYFAAQAKFQVSRLEDGFWLYLPFRCCSSIHKFPLDSFWFY